MLFSCSPTNISGYHVDTTVPQLIADLCSGLLIELSVELITIATVNGREMVSNVLVAFARIGRPQFVETFEVERMEDVPGGADDSLLEIEEAFVRCKQVVATVGRDLYGKPQRITNLIIYHNPARCRCT